jgi:hypothetical protein
MHLQAVAFSNTLAAEHKGSYPDNIEHNNSGHGSELVSSQPTSLTQLDILIIGLCILLRVYQLINVETSVRNKCQCSCYCALFTLHVSAPIGGHLQVVCNTKNSKAVTGAAYIHEQLTTLSIL